MFRVFYNGRWIENVPVTEALVFKEEGHHVQRIDLPIVPDFVEVQQFPKRSTKGETS